MTTRLAPGTQLGDGTPDPEGEVLSTSQWPQKEGPPEMPFSGSGVQDLEHAGQTRREEPDAGKRRKRR